MNVRELREMIKTMPDHWPVMVAVRSSEHSDEHGYLPTLDCKASNLWIGGSSCVIRVDYE